MTSLDFSSMRAAMVASQLRTNEVNDPRVVGAMESVAREAFVPANRMELAYVDVPIPLGGGRSLNSPLATGRLITEAMIEPGMKVLLIAAATGYAAAVVATLGATVVAVEEDTPLVESARKALADFPQISVVSGPLAHGAPDQSPFDIIVIDGAVEQVPSELWAQLRDGGRLTTGLLDQGVCRLATGVATNGKGSLRFFADAESALLPGFSVPRGFNF